MSRKKKPEKIKVNNLVVVSDTHCGCGLALCPPEVMLDDGGYYKQSKLQQKLWAMWQEFWGEFVPDATHGEPYAVVHNGDAIDGSHHRSTYQITHNLTTQCGIAHEILKPVVEACEGRYYHIRGTEAHVGQCFGRNTPVLMYDGSIKMVQDVANGDLVMGPDSKPRRVSGVTSGVDELFIVKQRFGEPYVVNSRHILALWDWRKKSYRNITVDDYIGLSKTERRFMYGYKAAVKFGGQPVPVDPYIFGLWLGDGSSRRPQLTCMDEPLISAWRVEAESRGLKVGVVRKKTTDCCTYHMGGVRGDRWPNRKYRRISDDLKTLGVYGNKHVPQCYIANSEDVRLSVLAGYIDTDGSLSNNCFDFGTKDQPLANGVAALCRSVGLVCRLRGFVRKLPSGKSLPFWRGTITGNTSRVPTRLKRKQAKTRVAKRNPLRTSIKVESIGVGEYYGFRVDGDHLFLLGDCTVVHNSGQEEESLARQLCAIPNAEGQHARYDLWKEVGGGLVHLLHHIGTTSSQGYEATAVHKELVESYVEAARWHEQIPDMIVRSHRHRYIETAIATKNGKGRAVVTPCFQAKTPFAWKIAGARLSQPQFGGIVVRWSQREKCLYIKEKVWTVERSAVE